MEEYALLTATKANFSSFLNQIIHWRSESLSVVSNSLWSHGIVYGIFQARILEWVADPFSKGSSPKDQTQVSCIAGRFFTSWASREALTEEILNQITVYEE